MSLRSARNETPADSGSEGLMCSAKGCPNAWSCDMGNGRLCTAHDRAEPHEWPAVTQKQLDAAADRAYSLGKPKPITATLSKEQKTSILHRLRDVVKGKNFSPHAWANNLIAKRENGGRLSPAQRHCLAVFEERHGNR